MRSVKGLCIAVALLCLTAAPASAEVVGASWYALDGNLTASGDVMSSGAYTIAHPWLPLGTTVLVTNVETGASTTAVVNDRGPAAWTGKGADLTPAVKAAIGMGDIGTVDVVAIS